jgi:hypothetical protein
MALIMTDKPLPANLFDAEHARRRATRGGVVRAELHARLAERLAEVKGARERVAWVEKGAVPEPGTHDAVVADMVLPLANDVPAFVYGCLQGLRPDGLLLATTLGVASFAEFRQAWADIGEPTGHVIPMTDVREAGTLLQRLKVALPVVDRDVLTLTFPDFATLYATLRAEGGWNAHPGRRPGLTTPALLRRMEGAYRARFARDDGRLPVTLEVIYLSGFRAAENQPGAAKRGSGKVSLVRILGNCEEVELTK